MMLEYSDSGAKLSFFNACETARAYTGGMGIGTLNEKQLHCAIKFFIEPDSACHEVRIGRNVADVRNEHGILEVQTRAFNAMRKNLQIFLRSMPLRLSTQFRRKSEFSSWTSRAENSRLQEKVPSAVRLLMSSRSCISSAN